MRYYDIFQKSTMTLIARVSAETLEDALERVAHMYGMSPESFQGVNVSGQEQVSRSPDCPLLLGESKMATVYLIGRDYQYGLHDTVVRFGDNVQLRKSGYGESIPLTLEREEMDALVKAWQAYKASHEPVSVDDGYLF